MCGICGIIDYSGNKIEKRLISRMSDLLAHRGPDNAGIFVVENEYPSVGLGHRRLKIIDLSISGNQPMSNEDGSILIVLNGEIYNYKELRPGLEVKGHVFKSKTDTECVIHLYEEYGQDCVNYLRGMFAFAIWDKQKGILMLARDRVGKKPLLYCHEGQRFCFASEFNSLLASGMITKEINKEAVDYYLSFGYIPAPLSIYSNVLKLPPAHTLILKDNLAKIRKYWSLDFNNKIHISEEEAADEVIKRLREAVKIRLYSDVPLGAFLSGGIDSSTIVALMAELSEDKVKTFSIGFEEEGYDELKYARRIAKKYDTEHSEFIVKPKALEILPSLVEHYGEPYADSSCIPTYYVCRETKKYVTVAMNGDGGDESFAGYERYPGMLAAEGIPFFARKTSQRLMELIPLPANPKNTLRRIKRFFDGAVLPYAERYLKWVGIFDENVKKDLYTQEFFIGTLASKPLSFIKVFLNSSHASGKGLEALLYTDIMTYLPYDLLVKVDIASMACSLEARSPFLDHEVMEFAAKLPAEYKIKNLTKKYILKKAIKDLVPAENINRKKMGFGVPVGEWFKSDLKEFLRQVLLSQRSIKRGYFKPEAVKNMVESHILGKADYSYRLWALFMLELWHNRFID